MTDGRSLSHEFERARLFYYAGGLTAVHTMSPERVTSLCLGECYPPSDPRKRIDPVEVVHIRPRASEDESVRELIEDPWQVLACDDAGDGCSVSFSDPDYNAQRETLYYVRAISEASPVVNADPLRCERNDSGYCVRANPCGRDEPCFSDTEERAWSSPIWLIPPPS